MNWGRLPTTVSSLTGVASRRRGAVAHAVSVARGDLGPDLGHDLDERPRRRARRAVCMPGDRDQARRHARHFEHGDLGALARRRAAARRRTRSRRRRAPARCRPRPSGRRSPARARASGGRPRRPRRRGGSRSAAGRRSRAAGSAGRSRASSEPTGASRTYGSERTCDALERRVVALEHEGEVELARARGAPADPRRSPPRGGAPRRRASARRNGASRPGRGARRRSGTCRREAFRRRPRRERGDRPRPRASRPTRAGRGGAVVARHRSASRVAGRRVAFEELQAGGALERRDLLADRGLRVAELDSRPPERSRLDDRLERRRDGGSRRPPSDHVS